MKFKVRTTNLFEKNLRLLNKRHYDMSLLTKVIKILANGDKIPAKYKNHSLTGNWKNFQELHIKPDWLLIYKYENDVLVLTLSATGTHSDLFSK